VHPIERLRLVARADGLEAGTVALEAADALRALADEPRALVTACRRLLDAHPDCGPLWWVSAHVLASSAPGEVAGLLVDLLVGDETADELASCLPSGAVVVAVPGPVVDRSLSGRPDVELRYVEEPFALQHARRIGAVRGATRWLIDEAAAAIEGAGLVLVEASAGGPDGVLVDRWAARLAAGAARAGAAIWAVAPIGAILPAALFSECAGRCGVALPGVVPRRAAGSFTTEGLAYGAPEEGERRLELLGAEMLGAVVTAEGPGDPEDTLGESECPVPLELVDRPR